MHKLHTAKWKNKKKHGKKIKFFFPFFITEFYYDNYIKNSFIYGSNIQKCEIISSYIEDTKLYISTSVNSKLIKERRLRYKVIMNECFNGSYVCWWVSVSK